MSGLTRTDGGQKAPPIELVLRFDPLTRKLELKGELQHSILLLMMLEGARIMITDFKDGKKTVTPGQVIVPLGPGIPRSI